MSWVAGVDGCRGGWVAALMRVGHPESIRIDRFDTIAMIADAPEKPRLIGVDIPIGLPERIEGAGRTPEQQIRPKLGRQAVAVFSMPGRAAVYAAPEYGSSREEIARAHALVKARAKALSDPPKGVTIFGFHILPKVREVDALLRRQPDLRERIFEVHPEVAFWALNGRAPVTAKKSTVEGLEERRRLLAAAGIPEQVLESPPPRGVKRDDVLDAIAALVATLDRAQGRAISFPDPPERDAYGIPVAIWAPRPRTCP